MQSHRSHSADLDTQRTLTRVLSRLESAPPVKSRTPEPPAARPMPAPVVRTKVPEDDAGRWPLSGLAPMTRVRTSFGEVHAVALRKGDLVRTANGSYKKIVWLQRIFLDEDYLDGAPDANPILLRKNSLGRGLPSADVLVSPRQVVDARHAATADLPREAAELMARPGVVRQRETGLSYTLFHVGEPCTVICEGLLIEMNPPWSDDRDD